jgi:hypothetical protein
VLLHANAALLSSGVLRGPEMRYRIIRQGAYRVGPAGWDLCAEHLGTCGPLGAGAIRGGAYYSGREQRDGCA